tara:strand:- start:9163 stop:10122 length:960 start_codon:yes stop_codon:yes gene_type:complete
MTLSRSDELTRFKTEIDLRQFAASVGFQLVRRQSSRLSAVMKHPCGDKIVVARAPSGQYVYFNVHGGDSGTIIDFVQTRERIGLGEVRKRLRNWNGSGDLENRTSPTLFEELEPATRDDARVLAEWHSAAPVLQENRYLCEERGIAAKILGDVKFQRRIRVDRRGNILFAHYRPSGLCGFERKNRGFTGFASGGTKALFCSQPCDDDRQMIVCETAIDALSVATLSGTSGKRFFSTAGRPSEFQINLLRSAAEKMPSGSEILLATDNDEAGRAMARSLRSALADVADRVEDHFPAQEGQDWNDVVMAARRNAVPQYRPA